MSIQAKKKLNKPWEEHFVAASESHDLAQSLPPSKKQKQQEQQQNCHSVNK